MTKTTLCRHLFKAFLTESIPTFQGIPVKLHEMVKDILRQTFLIRQTLQENDNLRLPHGVHALRGETPALPVHICTDGNMGQQSRIAKRMPKFHCTKTAPARINFTARIVVLSVTQTNYVLHLLPWEQAHPKQEQLHNSQFTAKEEPEHYSSQSDLGLTPRSRPLAVSVFKWKYRI